MAAAFDFIDNRGPNSVFAALRRLCKQARTVDWVVAFASKSGVEAVLPFLQTVANRGRVRVVVGLYLGGTETQALRLLHKASQRTRGKFVVRVARNPSLHRKVCIFGLQQHVSLLIGSSNLTAKAITSDGESNGLVRFPAGSQLHRAIVKSVPELAAERNSLPLTPELIRRYDALRRRGRRVSLDARELGKLLAREVEERRPRSSKSIRREPEWWRFGMTGIASRQTVQAIETETDWGRRGWSWVSNGPKLAFPGDKLLIFDLTGPTRWATLAEVKDVTTLTAGTPDGRDFLAYLRRRGKLRRRLITRKFWGELRDAGIRVSKGERERNYRLTPKQGVAVEALFRGGRA